MGYVEYIYRVELITVPAYDRSGEVQLTGLGVQAGALVSTRRIVTVLSHHAGGSGDWVLEVLTEDTNPLRSQP
jgi:hypothetical protein